jgi:hypothetical protein
MNEILLGKHTKMQVARRKSFSCLGAVGTDEAMITVTECHVSQNVSEEIKYRKMLY